MNRINNLQKCQYQEAPTNIQQGGNEQRPEEDPHEFEHGRYPEEHGGENHHEYKCKHINSLYNRQYYRPYGRARAMFRILKEINRLQG